MLAQAATVTARILRFRAGPQDFPYSAALTRTIVAATLITSFLQYRLTLATFPALVHAVVSVAVLAAFTWQLLRLRKLESRAQQTVNSLFITGSALTLLLLGPLAAIAPQMLKIAENPDLAATEPLPALPMLAVLVLSLWNLAVSANIYRHALNLNLAIGVAVSLLGALVSVSVAGTLSTLVAP